METNKNIGPLLTIKVEWWGLCSDGTWVSLFDDTVHGLSEEEFEELKNQFDENLDGVESLQDGNNMLDKPLKLSSIKNGSFVVIPEPRFFLALKVECTKQ